MHRRKFAALEMPGQILAGSRLCCARSRHCSYRAARPDLTSTAEAGFWSAGAFLLHRAKTVEVQAGIATLAGASRALRRVCRAAVRALQDKAQSPRCRSAGPMTEQGRIFLLGKATSARMPMLPSVAAPHS